MITAVDTSVLIDVFANDPEFGQASSNGLRQCLQAGTLIACDIVWSETRAVFPEVTAFRRAMSELGVMFSPLTKEAAEHAGGAWKTYRQKGGKRSRLVADFMIGAHAVYQADCLLTRDRGYYREHFKGLKIVDVK